MLTVPNQIMLLSKKEEATCSDDLVAMVLLSMKNAVWVELQCY